MFSLIRLLCLQYVFGLLAFALLLSAPGASNAQRAFAFPGVPFVQPTPLVGGYLQAFQQTQQMFQLAASPIGVGGGVGFAGGGGFGAGGQGFGGGFGGGLGGGLGGLGGGFGGLNITGGGGLGGGFGGLNITGGGGLGLGGGFNGLGGGGGLGFAGKGLGGFNGRHAL